MPDSRTLHLKFVLRSEEPISSTDFVSLFECIDDFSRVVAENEVRNLIEELNLPNELRFGVLDRIHRLGRRLPAPAQVEEIERGSWAIEVVLPGAAILFILQHILAPTLKAAWDESRMRDFLFGFLRDRVFLGARRRTEEKAVDTPRYGNLRVQEVHEVAPANSGEPRIEIQLQRTEVLEVRLSARELIEELLRRFRPT